MENIEDDNFDISINENRKTIIKETKEQLMEKDESKDTLKNRWYDKECKIAIEEMKAEKSG